jgi:threonine aldolase
MNFASDNVYGVHPHILAALGRVNAGTAKSYAGDAESRAAEERLSNLFECEVKAFLVTTGTAANGLALSALAPGYGAVICHAEAHISCDECNSPEFFTGGAKILGLHGPGGKITPALIEKTLNGFIRGEHDPKPKAVSLTNATELGTVYTPTEVKAVSDLIRPRGMKLHMDGARFSNAIASLGCSPAELTWKAGVDVMSFGATKNGAMMLEAVVFFEHGLADEFIYRRMRAGQLVSKSRYLGAQMLAYLDDGLWLQNARLANGLAARLAQGLKGHARIKVPYAVQVNEVFAVMPRALYEALLAEGAYFYDWMTDSLGDLIGPDEVFTRFVLSFATPPEDVERFLALVARLAK